MTEIVDKINKLLGEVWETTPQPRKLNEGEYRLFHFSDYKGYAWLDGIVNTNDFAWLLETARMSETALSYHTEWCLCDSNGVRLAQSKGLTALLEQVKEVSDPTKTPQECPICKGTGLGYSGKYHFFYLDCENCNGTGKTRF